jgi:hypothetical protein
LYCEKRGQNEIIAVPIPPQKENDVDDCSATWVIVKVYLGFISI